MRLSLRFIIPLALTLGVIAFTMVPLVDALTLRWFVRDIDIRSRLIANTMQESLVMMLDEGGQISRSNTKISRLFNRAVEDERLYAMALCDASGIVRFQTATFSKAIGCVPKLNGAEDGVLNLPQGPVHVAFHKLEEGEKNLGQLVLVHDMSFVKRRSSDTRNYIVWFFAILGAVISLLTVFIAQMSLRGWIAGMRALLKGEGLLRPLSAGASPELRPIVKDLRSLVRDLESERRARDESQITWTPRALKEILKNDLAGDEVLIVSNREPYIHEKRKDKVEVRFPASGLVTALEPIMRACSGTWIAHGGGSADKETVDKHDRVQVPPDDPSYNLRRVWLTKEEEQGYYYGFANEGL